MTRAVLSALAAGLWTALIVMRLVLTSLWRR